MTNSSESESVQDDFGQVRVVRGVDLIPSPWANARGTTREIHRTADWRLSLATVDNVGAFSVLPDVRRYLLLASDTRLYLAIDGTTRSLSLGDIVEFEGDAAVEVVGLSATASPLNLMTYGGVRGWLTVRRLDAATIVSNRDAVAVVVLAGRLHVDNLVLGPHDTLLPTSAHVDVDGEAATLACVVLRAQAASGC